MVQPSRVSEDYANKVPEVTLGFWIIKILATTLGETLGDSVTMTWLKADVMVNSGYLVGSAIFLSALIVIVAVQILPRDFIPSSIGRSSWHQPLPARLWQTLPPDHWGSAILEGH